MLARPTDRNGDILPVAVPGDLLSGTEAAASALRDHLRLFPGDWWENAEKGNPVFDLITVSRRTEQDARTLSSALTSYLLSFSGIRTVSDVQASIERQVFSFSCIAHTESGETVPIHFAAP